MTWGFALEKLAKHGHARLRGAKAKAEALDRGKEIEGMNPIRQKAYGLFNEKERRCFF